MDAGARTEESRQENRSGGNLGPVPARLVFLTELPQVKFGHKVRFLGWSEYISSFDWVFKYF